MMVAMALAAISPRFGGAFLRAAQAHQKPAQRDHGLAGRERERPAPAGFFLFGAKFGAKFVIGL